MQLDAKALADATAEIVKAHTASLSRRIEALEARPAPERGEKGEAGERGPDGATGRDGVGVAGAIIDRSGVLVLTLTDGTTRDLGMVVGKDGTDGRPGEKGADGKDGTNGTDGRDGFSLEDFDVEAVDERTIKMTFTQGDVKHSYELELPIPIYRGVFKDGESYRRGDVVTWGGSSHIAERETTEKPDSKDCGWKLMVKRGRDGKNAAA